MADIIIDGTTGANRLLMLDSAGKIPAVDGSQLTNFAAGNIVNGTISIARIDTGTTANKIVKLDGNAKLPAVDGSQITNMPGATKSSNDPTISTNPSGGVGSEWHNTSTGEAYICTDATAGANVWTNIGAGSDNIQPYYYGGDIAGFTSGGYVPNSASNVIDQFSYTSNTTATDHGDLATAVNNGAGSQSSTDGYHFGGSAGGASNMFNKFSFASTGNATSVGTIDTARSSVAGYSSSTHGFYSGGTPAGDGAVKKFAFSSESSISAHGNLQNTRYGNAATSSETHGFKMGGYPKTVTIDKFAFASNTTAADHGDLRANRNDNTGHSDMTNGYSAGGETSSGGAAIDKFAFASNTTAAGHGNLSVAREYGPWGNNY